LKDLGMDNIKTDQTETGYEYMDWIQLAQDRVQWQDLVATMTKLFIH